VGLGQKRKQGLLGTGLGTGPVNRRLVLVVLALLIGRRFFRGSRRASRASPLAAASAS